MLRWTVVNLVVDQLWKDKIKEDKVKKYLHNAETASLYEKIDELTEEDEENDSDDKSETYQKKRSYSQPHNNTRISK